MAYSDGKLAQGQLYDSTDDFVIPYTQQMMEERNADLLVGDARTEINPNDRGSSMVKVFGAPDGIDDFYRSFPGRVNFDFPTVLKSITVVYNTQKAVGEYAEHGEGWSQGSSANLDFSLNGNAQSSVSALAELVIQLEPTNGSNIKVTHYQFYLSGNITTAQIIAKLATLGVTVTDLPRWNPAPANLVITGQQLAVRVDARIQQHWNETVPSQGSLGTESFTWTEGRGFSLDGGINVRTVQLPETIHGVITIQDSSRLLTVEAKASATIVGGNNFPARSVVVNKETDPVIASVTPNQIDATKGATTIPTTGMYIIDSDVRPYKWGYSTVFVTIVNFADL